MSYPPLPGSWDDMIVIRAGTYAHGHQLADQHIARQFASRDVPVLYVNPPVTAVGARRNPQLADCFHGPALRLYRDNWAVLNTKAPPGQTRWGVSRITESLQVRALRTAVKTLKGSVRATLSVSSSPVLLRVAGERTSVFWARDDYAAGAALMDLNAEKTAATERRTAALADVIIAVSPIIAERWARLGYRTSVVPNGCDVGTLASIDDLDPAPDVYLPRPIAGVVGTIGERIDLALLKRFADTGASLLLVGQKQRNLPDEALRPLLDMPNVQWVGHQPVEKLPEYLSAIDVGLVPYTDSAFNRASFPLKTLEYLAAGRAVVSTPLPASAWLATSLITIAEARDFVDAASAAMDDPGGKAERDERREFAAHHTWVQRADSILDLLP